MNSLAQRYSSQIHKALITPPKGDSFKGGFARNIRETRQWNAGKHQLRNEILIIVSQTLYGGVPSTCSQIPSIPRELNIKSRMKGKRINEKQD